MRERVPKASLALGTRRGHRPVNGGQPGGTVLQAVDFVLPDVPVEGLAGFAHV